MGPMEAVAGENPDLIVDGHAIWIRLNAIYIDEDLGLEERAKARVYEFGSSFDPLPLTIATRSPGNSVAIA